MPTWLVEWTPQAEADLARIYVDHPDLRNEITAVAHQVDNQLQTDPRQFAAESHPGPDGIETAVAFEPLSSGRALFGVEFLFADTIRVVRVWLAKKRKRDQS
jgi:plasmid stabilization system protein ParE